MLTGALLVDGIPVGRESLRRMVDDVERACAELGAGPGRAIMTGCRTGIAVVAAVVAARRLGAAGALAPRAGSQVKTRPTATSVAEVVDGAGG
uniref:hypothetical protein n=1 Tax=Actinoplanes sp. TFC3 TaxID=1710355 RepID=UPI000AE20D24